MYYQRFRHQLTFDILNYIEYDKEAAKKFLIDELGWRDYGGKHHESIYTRIFQSYILPVKFGFDKRKAHYSSLILAGQMSRQDALIKLQELPYNPSTINSDIEYLAKKFQISIEDFQNIMSMRPNSYEDFSPRFPKFIRKMESRFFSNLFRIRRVLLRYFK